MDPDLQLPVRRPFRWQLFLIIWAACIFGVVAVLPYSLALQGDNLALMIANLAMPFWQLLLLQIGQNAVVFAIASGVGLLLAARTGLGLPFLERWLDRQPIWHKLPRVALLAAILGVIGSVLVIVLDSSVFSAGVQEAFRQAGLDSSSEALQPAWWKGLLASFYGGIAEEVLLRLFLFTLLAWLGSFISRTSEGRPTIAVLWTANILAAVLFGLGHLPTAVAMGVPLTPIFLVRTLVLNGVIGLIAGWLYFTRGLESAIICHFSADIVLHVIPPLVAGLL